MDITEEVVGLVARKRSGREGPNGTNSEALQGWLLKFGDHRKKLLISVESFADWLANQKLSRAAYWALLYGRLIALDKIPGLRPMRVGETWRRIFAKCVLKVTVSEETHV